jgi:hypothetical protein
VSGVILDQLKAEEEIIEEFEGKKFSANPNNAKTESKMIVSAAVEDGPKDTAVLPNTQKLTTVPSIGKPSP